MVAEQTHQFWCLIEYSFHCQWSACTGSGVQVLFIGSHPDTRDHEYTSLASLTAATDAGVCLSCESVRLMANITQRLDSVSSIREARTLYSLNIKRVSINSPEPQIEI